MRVSLVHDWLLGMRGGEKVLEAFCDLFPQADIHTLLYNPEKVSDKIRARQVRASWMQDLPRVDRYYRYLLPLMPQAIGRIDLSDRDLVVSCSHCVAKGVSLSRPGGRKAVHICYCNSPMRYVYDQFDNYFTQKNSSLGRLTKLGAQSMRAYLASWDRRSNQSVDLFVANSQNVRRRIQKHYDRDAEVIYPPVDVDFYTPGKAPSEDPYFLIAGALVPYKRVDLAVEAARRLNVRLKVVGVGTEEHPLRRLARGAPVEFLGWQGAESLRDLYRGCVALLFPQEEDFGIAAVEALACGRPVIAYKAGGALETVEHGKTGLFFDRQEPDSLAMAMAAVNNMSFEPRELAAGAQRFHRDLFKRRFSELAEKTVVACRRGIERKQALPR
ncbi:MAG: glycosyltransferase [Elusimicrobia bacterium]|nr:glycosyltransferase [Elusimicrobiota bacterium]